MDESFEALEYPGRSPSLRPRSRSPCLDSSEASTSESTNPPSDSTASVAPLLTRAPSCDLISLTASCSSETSVARFCRRLPTLAFESSRAYLPPDGASLACLRLRRLGPAGSSLSKSWSSSSSCCSSVTLIGYSLFLLVPLGSPRLGRDSRRFSRLTPCLLDLRAGLSSLAAPSTEL